jgi:hypothetical protein
MADAPLSLLINEDICLIRILYFLITC